MKKQSIFLLLLLLFGNGCDEESGYATGSLKISFPSTSQLRSSLIDPRTTCVWVKVYNQDRSFYKEGAVSGGSGSVTISGIPTGKVTVETVLTDGIKIGEKCSGNTIDRISTVSSIRPGNNVVEIYFPRAYWIIEGGPLSLNLTNTTSTESLSGFIIKPHNSSPLNPGYVNNSLIFVGNLPDCDSTLGRYCGVRAELSSFMIAPGKIDHVLGNEFTGSLYPQTGWALLSPLGTSFRYLGIVSKPPCSYLKPPDMISCDYSTNTDLSSYMGLRFTDGRTMSGYLWEILVNSSSTTLTCYSDIDLTNQITCPNDVDILFPSPPYTASPAKNTSALELRTQQVIPNVRIVVDKVFEKYSFSLGSIVYVKITRDLTFDLGLHQITAVGDPLINLSNFYLFYSQISVSGATIIPVDLGGNKFSPVIGNLDIMYPFLVPYFIFSDTVNLLYTGVHYLDLIYVQGGSLFRMPADNPGATPQQLTTYSSGTPICLVQNYINPLTGTGHIFVREYGLDNNCLTSDDILNYINSKNLPTDNPNTLPYFREILGAHFSGNYVAGFLLYDDQGQQILYCDTSANCQTNVASVSSFYKNVGYSFITQKSYFIADGNLYEFDGFSAQSILNPVDTCSLIEKQIFCSYTDPATAQTTVILYDLTTASASNLATFSAYGMVEKILPTEKYLVLRYLDQQNNLGYLAVSLSSGGVTTVNFPAGRNPLLDTSIGKTILGFDLRQTTYKEFCYLKEDSISVGTCIENSYIPANSLFPHSGFIQDPNVYNIYFKGLDKIYIVLNCTRSGTDCTGGELHEFNSDLIGSRPVFTIPSGEQATDIFRIGPVLLIFTEEPGTSPAVRRVYYANTLNGTSKTLEGTGGEFYPITTYP